MGAGHRRPGFPVRAAGKLWTAEATTMRHSNCLRPEADVLESRALLSGARALHPSPEVGRAHPDTFIIPHGPPTPLRTGGAAALVGSVLLVVVNKPGNFPNETTIQDDGAGNVTVEWNGHTPPTFHGVTQIIVDARGKMNTVTFNLTGSVTKAQEVEVQLDGTKSFFSPNLGAFNANGLLTFQIQTAPAPKNLAKGP
jgi:hypothetical protein